MKLGNLKIPSNKTLNTLIYINVTKKTSSLAITNEDVPKKVMLYYYASNILNTPLQAVTAPTPKIAQEIIDSVVESPAKRKKTPKIPIKTPMVINL